MISDPSCVNILTMYYILSSEVTLWGWQKGPYYYRFKGMKKVSIPKEEYDFLKLCDGSTEIEESRLSEFYDSLAVIDPCEKNSRTLMPGQLIDYPNIEVHSIDWTITDRCNHNCLHCFHAEGNSIQRNEFTYEEALSFLDQVKECGIRSLRLTGGEPTLYPHFEKIIDEVYERKMRVSTLITNGSLLTDEMLDFLKAHDERMELMLSFDGIGFHDWLRQRKGSEEMVLDTIRRAKAKGFRIFINMNVNRRNIGVIKDSLKLLDSLSVDYIRLIRTTEAPRWVENSDNASLTFQEYYDFALDLTRWYIESGLKVPFRIWQTLEVEPQEKRFGILPVKRSKSKWDPDRPICPAARFFKPSVQPNGDIVPCSPAAGYFMHYNIHLGNIKERTLQEILTESAFTERVCQSVGDKFESNRECGECKYSYACLGGCPALSILSGGNEFSCDRSKCTFFKGGYYEKFTSIFDDSWTNVRVLEESTN